MLDIGWMELVVIGVVALIVVGPKDLPVMFRTAGQFMGKARAMAREFQRSMEDAAKESGLSESAKQLNSLSSTLNTKLNLTSATNSARRYAENVIKEGDAKPAGDPPAAAVATTPPAAAGATPAAATATTPPVAPEAAPASAAPAEPAPAAPATARAPRARAATRQSAGPKPAAAKVAKPKPAAGKAVAATPAAAAETPAMKEDSGRTS